MELEFTTRNAAIAATLHVCGVRHPKDEKGDLTPAHNVYFLEDLERLGLTGKGLTFEQAAMKAWRTKRLGSFGWRFVKDQHSDRICRHYNLIDAKAQAVALGCADPHGEEFSPKKFEEEDIVEMFVLFQRARKGMIEAALAVVPLIPVDWKIKSAGNDEISKFKISGKLISLNASKATREHLNL